ncbi:MAG: hypothetical protein OEZ19_10130, partial [Paracoccaceae bacterium]|nr:hypothetical protein [Paracoccaceae bacterium]
PVAESRGGSPDVANVAYTDVNVDTTLSKTSMSENKFSDEDMKLAEYIFAKVRELLPKAKKPNYDKWANCIRLMRQQDNRTPDEIRRVFDWANRDNFWQTNIRSPEKLRQKFDELEIKMKRSGGNNAGYRPSISEQVHNANADDGREPIDSTADLVD